MLDHTATVLFQFRAQGVIFVLHEELHRFPTSRLSYVPDIISVRKVLNNQDLALMDFFKTRKGLMNADPVLVDTFVVQFH